MTQTNQSSCRIISSWLIVSALVLSSAVINDKIIPKKNVSLSFVLNFSIVHIVQPGVTFPEICTKTLLSFCLWKLEQDVLLSFFVYHLSNEATKQTKTDLGVGGLGQTVIAGWKIFLCRKILLQQEFKLSETESSSTGKSYKKCVEECVKNSIQLLHYSIWAHWQTYIAVLHLFSYF